MVDDKEPFRKKFLPFFIAISGSIFLLDQATKYIILLYSFHWTSSIFSISLVTNTGAGFGILPGKNAWLALISTIVALAIISQYRRIPQNAAFQTLFALFLGGILGNLFDRLVYGHVIDFINFHFWPSFNIADAAISMAVMGLILCSWKYHKNT